MKTFLGILCTLVCVYNPVPDTQARELDAYDYTILAQETNGQCASPGAQYGCKYDSNETYYPE